MWIAKTASLAWCVGDSAMATCVISQPAQAMPIIYAGLGRRFLAWVLDRIVLYPFTYLLSLMLLSMFGNTLLWVLSQILIQGVLEWFYFSMYNASVWQGTVGKRALGLQIQTLEGQRLTRQQSSRRFWMGFLVGWLTLSVGYALAAFNPKHQGLHDQWAKTIVTIGQYDGLGALSVCLGFCLLGLGIVFFNGWFQPFTPFLSLLLVSTVITVVLSGINKMFKTGVAGIVKGLAFFSR